MEIYVVLSGYAEDISEYGTFHDEVYEGAVRTELEARTLAEKLMGEYLQNRPNFSTPKWITNDVAKREEFRAKNEDESLWYYYRKVVI